MEDESTVMTVSQGISRPNGANTALNFFGRGNSRRTVGKQTDGRERWLLGLREPPATVEAMVSASWKTPTGECEAGGGFGWRRIKDLHRVDGLHHLGFVPRLVPGRNSDAIFGGRVMFADDAENDQPPANSAPKATILPLLVLKKLRKSRGFMAGLWVDGWDGHGSIGDSDDGRRWR
jgi:hypothetical protein